ncbi:mevalonate kinase [candidate division KSB1 bacterium]|nr:mevalonate kinase [candidate division KSB1 bacterium]
MRAVAPGKLILSGEHAVVYGKPALVMAVDRFASAAITQNSDARVHFELADLNERGALTLQGLRELKARLVRDYQKFLDGQVGIRDVLTKPFHLFQFLFITLVDGEQIRLDRGIHIKISSNIPIGSGMGSSAATMLAVLKGLSGLLDLDLKAADYFAYALEAEKLQHGRPSGADPYVSLHGGFVRFQNQKAARLEIPSVPFHLVNTGTPMTTTGECVAHVAHHFGDASIWDDFATVTNEMQRDLATGDLAHVQRAVRENHKLLAMIGVVPQRVSDFIHDVEMAGGAAKIAGAGSVRGSAGGMVIVFCEEAPHALAERHGFQLLNVKGESRGARIV